jgi:hypothetical protein
MVVVVELEEKRRCGYNFIRHLVDSMSSQDASKGSEILCTHCSEAMEGVLDVPFRIGGTSGSWHLLFGDWAELGEGLLSFDVNVCHKCGRVQLFAEEKTRESLQIDRE